ncbi:MAG: amino acid adenylation domain-containing protein [Deltaproteobacteria bacterium]|nr:amino acid adenylation domain-containing protein [Deltaproteobacteria bacterium]
MRDYLLHHLLQRSALQYPDNVAVIFKEKSVTYSDLERQSSSIAGALQQLGIRKGDRVGIMFSKSIEQIVALFGILKSGAIYVPLDPAAPAARVEYMIRHCGIECLITTPGNLKLLSLNSEDALGISTALLIGTDAEVVNHGTIVSKSLSLDVEAAGDHGGFQAVEMSDSSPAYILHTSGSTGNPKGVAISHLNALTFIEMAASYFDVTASDRFCSHAPLHFDLSVFDIFVAIKQGAAIVLLPEMLSTFPVKLAEYIDKEQITVWNSVSSVLTLLADKGVLESRNLDSLRLVHFSGDIMPVKYLRLLAQRMKNAAFYNIYGQTEANSSLCYPIGAIPDDDSWRIPIGKPFPNFDVFALNGERQVVSHPGDEGELYVSSSTVAYGYWNDRDMSGEKFVPDPRYPFLDKIVYKTGDLVRIDEDGNYLFSGRTDHMVKSRGYRIELAEIETVLSGHPDVVAAVAIPIPDDLVGNRIFAVIAPASGCSVGTEELFRYCTPRLPKYMIPETMAFRDSLPMTSSGKVDRKKLGEELVNSEEWAFP